MPSRPNFLIIMPDQLRADCVGCFGNDIVQTPNIDALAARGVRFGNAYANHPVCGPSRVSLMTGWYPHTRGHRTLTHLVKPWEPNLLRYLKEAGYNVAWAGQRGDMFAPGVTEASTHFCGWLVKPTALGMGPQYPEGSKEYDTFLHGVRPGDDPWLDFDEACVQTAEQWLEGSPPEPWVLFVPLIFPHLPFEVEARWYDLYAGQAMPPPIPPTAGKPAFHDALRAKCGSHRLDTEDWAEITRLYYGMISRVDDQLGRLVAKLGTTGAGARTSVWFFTDHGEYLGDFGLVEKWPSGLDDCLLRNPLIVTLPGGAEGAVAAGFTEMVDILPTMLELAETDARHTHFGHSLAATLRSPATVVRDAAFSEGGFAIDDVHLFESPTGEYRKKGELQHVQPSSVGKAAVIRTEDFTYVYRLYESDELYDRRRDPHEIHNRIDDPALVDTAADLKDRLFGWLMSTSDVIPWDADPRFPKVPNGYHTDP
jgi:arylsulfatase A-like enzyme